MWRGVTYQRHSPAAPRSPCRRHKGNMPQTYLNTQRQSRPELDRLCAPIALADVAPPPLFSLIPALIANMCRETQALGCQHDRCTNPAGPRIGYTWKPGSSLHWSSCRAKVQRTKHKRSTVYLLLSYHELKSSSEAPAPRDYVFLNLQPSAGTTRSYQVEISKRPLSFATRLKPECLPECVWPRAFLVLSSNTWQNLENVLDIFFASPLVAQLAR